MKLNFLKDCVCITEEILISSMVVLIDSQFTSCVLNIFLASKLHNFQVGAKITCVGAKIMCVSANFMCYLSAKPRLNHAHQMILDSNFAYVYL